MPNVTMYSTGMCPYCTRARMLLDQKGVGYDEIRVEHDRDKYQEMLQRSGRNTVPQIFVDEFHVGGYDDMAAMDAYGKLDPLLGLAPHPDSAAVAHGLDASEDGPT